MVTAWCADSHGTIGPRTKAQHSGRSLGSQAPKPAVGSASLAGKYSSDRPGKLAPLRQAVSAAATGPRVSQQKQNGSLKPWGTRQTTYRTEESGYSG